MRQIFYIEADEEMISIIGRLRKSPASENVIVAPQRALILQSIVNLRLLSHDAHKNGKEIIVVTQDAQSRSLCEKAGIRTQAVLDEEHTSDNQPPYQSPAVSMPNAVHAPYNKMPPSSQQPHEASSQDKLPEWQLPFADALGSLDFFGDTAMPTPQTPQSEQPQQPQAFGQQTQQPQAFGQQPQPEPFRQQPIESLSKQPYGDMRQVTVRDNNPKQFTSLNSQRFEEEKLLHQQKSFTPPSLRGATPARQVFAPPHEFAPPIENSFTSAQDKPHTDTVILPGFLDHKKTESKMTPPIAQKIPEKQTVVSDGGKMRAFFAFFGIISVLSVAGVFAYLFLPKATVHVKLKTLTQNADFEFEGSLKTTDPSVESKAIPVRLIEEDQEITRSFDTTGKASLADQKARGSVIVYNEYNVEKQLLVASTRLLSQDGKVFRLLSGVTVPGMTTINGKVEPGVIEASIVADQPGQEYNIAPTSFSIPGFEGSPKYAKFHAKSSSTMSGGGTSGSDVAAVSDQDIAKAKKTLELEIRYAAAEFVNKHLESGEQFLADAIDVAVISSSASPQSGAVTDTFEYHVKMHIRAFVFSEEDLKKMAGTLLEQQQSSKASGLSLRTVDVQYGEPTADFTFGTLRINAHAVAHFESGIDENRLKSELLGQNESDIATLLQKYTQIDTISLELWPEFLANRIPTRADRVNIIIDSPDEKNAK
jgi:hypothetical protein